MFGKPVPSFKLHGKKEITTVTGGLMSLTIIIITFLFSLSTLVKLVQRDNPSVVQFVRENAHTIDDEYELDGRGDSMIAFAFGGLRSGIPYTDPRILKWYADYGSSDAGVWSSIGVPFHSCTDEDLEKFNTPDNQSAALVQSLKELGAF